MFRGRRRENACKDPGMESFDPSIEDFRKSGVPADLENLASRFAQGTSGAAG